MIHEKKRNSIKSKENTILFLTVLFGSLAIILKSYFHLFGYVTPDSTYYLRLAQNLIDGHGLFTVASGMNNSNEKEFFAIWPIGYPVLIAFVSKISGLTVFWASKFLNVLFFISTVLLLKRMYVQEFSLYVLLLFSASFIEIFSYTWSEVPFTFFLLLFVYALQNILQHDFSFKWQLLLTISILALFLCKYIGAFSGIVVVIYVAYAKYHKSYDVMWRLVGIGIVSGLLMLLYLYNNFLQTGFVTGMERIGAEDTLIDFLYMLWMAFWGETDFLEAKYTHLSFIAQMLIIWFVFKKTKIIFSTRLLCDRSNCVLLVVAGVYILSVIILRYMTFFDSFGFRFFAPVTLLIFVFLLNGLEKRHELKKKISTTLMVLAVLSYSYHVFVHVTEDIMTGNGYEKEKVALLDQYQNIAGGDIVVFGERHLNYLRPYILNLRPRYKPYFAYKEAFPDFLKRIRKEYPDKKIYIRTKNINIKRDWYHPSVEDFLNKNNQKDFVLIAGK